MGQQGSSVAGRRQEALRIKLLPYMPYIFLSIMVIGAGVFWRMHVSWNARHVVSYVEGAAEDTEELGFNPAPLIEAVGGLTKLLHDGSFIVILSLAVVAFVCMREISMIQQYLWSGTHRGEALSLPVAHAPARGGKRSVGPIIAGLVLVGFFPALLLFCGSAQTRAIEMPVAAVPYPVYKLWMYFRVTALLWPTGLLIPYFGFITLYLPLFTLRLSIQKALQASSEEQEPKLPRWMRPNETSERGLTGPPNRG